MTHQKLVTIGLIGNPNTGKTSLLNSLTGLSLQVGNWSGTTVEKKEGKINFQGTEMRIVDLPGTYSIAPYSEEEKISRDFITKQNPDVVVQIIDVNALTRNLLMTLELLALGKNLILAFNFNQEAKRRGIKVDVDGIQQTLGIPVIPIEANTGANKEKLLEKIVSVSRRHNKIPDYLKLLLKNPQEIEHHRAISFIKNRISPFYSTTQIRSPQEKIDSFLLNKYTAFPAFLLVVFLMFKTTFALSTPLVDIIDNFFNHLGQSIETLDLRPFFSSFLTEGVIGGVGSVLTFTPLIFILFFIISLLEDSGYLARTVVLVDRLFHKFGISGCTFIPMILGFGCNVPAIMATRTIHNKKERLIAIFINPFMSCGARLPVYVLFTSIFFPRYTSYIVMFLYLFGVLTALAASFVLSKIIPSPERSTLIIELPPYRLPTLRNVTKHAWYQTSLFLKRAGTIIFISVIIIWLLASAPAGVEYGSQHSLLGRMGQSIAPIFQPLGFGHWTLAVALLFGLVAKEVVIGALGTLYGASEAGLISALPLYLSPLGAFSLLLFILLYIPCLATVATIRKETNSWPFTLAQASATLVVAWLVSFSAYTIGSFLGFA